MIIAKAPRALNPTTAPYRPNTFTSMMGCEVQAIYDANGLKFDALDIVDLATGFQILAVLDGPRCWRAPALSWAQTEPLLQSCCISGVRFIPWLVCPGSMTVRPSGLRRWLKAPVRTGVCSKSTAARALGLAEPMAALAAQPLPLRNLDHRTGVRDVSVQHLRIGWGGMSAPTDIIQDTSIPLATQV